MQNDMLQEMLTIQRASQEQRGYFFESMSVDEAVEYIRKHALYLQVELGEFLVELPGFKDWKKYDKNAAFPSYAAQEELIDVIHFLLNICLALGMSAEDLYNTYLRKAEINVKRLEDTEHYKRDTEAAE